MKRCLPHSRFLWAAALLALVVPLEMAGCSSGDKVNVNSSGKTDKTPDAGVKSDPAPGGGRGQADDSEKPKMPTIVLTSTAFAEGQPIPPRHTGDGEDVSPPLRWSALPQDARELALICDDPDAPREEPWVHWVIYKIPANVTGLPEGVAKDLRPVDPAGSTQGRNSWPDGQNTGYRGPAPPKGKPHRYFFKLYVLDKALPDKPGMTKKELLEAMSGHVIGIGELMGTYQR